VNLMTRKGIIAVGLISALLIGGLGAMVVTAGDDVSIGDAAPTVTLSDQKSGTLTVLVGARVEGRIVPLGNVQLDVLSVNSTKEAGEITIILEKVAEGTTNVSGAASFDLECGKYLVVAHYNGLKAFGKINLDEDETVKMLLHNFERQFPAGADRINRVTISIEYETA